MRRKVYIVDQYIVERVYKEAEEILETKKTIREIAKINGVSKSTVHKDLKERLLELNQTLHQQIAEIFQEHIEIRHIRGGESTRRKYLHE